MLSPKVSIVICTYNRKDRVIKAIDSVLNQTYPDFEVLVVDDCSTDSTYETLTAKYGKDDRVKILKTDTNSGGPAKPRNKGVLESTGEYIGFLDSDNLFRPDHIAVLVNELDRNPGVDLVYGDRYMIYEGHPELNNIGLYYDYDSAKLMERNYIDTSDFLVRRKALFDIGGWDEGHRRMLDWNLVARLDKGGYKMQRVPTIITDYIVHDGDMLSGQQPADDEWFVLHMPGGVKIQGAHDCDIVLPYLGEKPKPKVAIFTITWERLKYTQESFESLHKTAGYDFDHYIVDNGSKDGTVEFLHSYKEKYPDRVHLLLNEDNKGICIASNQILRVIAEQTEWSVIKTDKYEEGRRHQKYDIIGKFDNDAYCLTDGWLAKIVEVWNANHRMALSCYISGLKDNAGGVPRMAYGRIKNELVGITKHLGGICCFTSAKIRLDFQLDESEALHTMDDLFFSQYIRERGYQMAYLENYYINHGPKGTESQINDYPSYFERRSYEKTHKYEKAK